MSLMPQLWDMPPPRNVGEAVANMLRMAALLPIVRRQYGLGQAGQALSMMGTLPEEFRPGFFAEVVRPIVERYGLPGFPQALPAPATAQLGDVPEAMQRQEAVVTSLVDAYAPPGISPQVREALKRAVLQRVASVPIAGYRSGDQFVPSANSLLEASARAAAVAESAAQTIPVYATGMELISDPQVRAVVEVDPMLKMLASRFVNLRSGGETAFLSSVVQNARAYVDSVLSSVTNLVSVLRQEPSVEGYEAARNAIEGARKIVALSGPAGEAALNTLNEIAASVMRGRVPVTVLTRKGEPKTVLMSPPEAQQYIRIQTEEFRRTEIAPLAQALARTTDPKQRMELRQSLERTLQRGSSLGLDVRPLWESAFATARDAEEERRLQMAQLRASIAAAEANRQQSLAQIRESEMRRAAAAEEFAIQRMMRGILRKVASDPRGVAGLSKAEQDAYFLYRTPREVLATLQGRGEDIPASGVLSWAQKSQVEFASSAAALNELLRRPPRGSGADAMIERAVYRFWDTYLMTATAEMVQSMVSHPRLSALGKQRFVSMIDGAINEYIPGMRAAGRAYLPEMGYKSVVSLLLQARASGALSEEETSQYLDRLKAAMGEEKAKTQGAPPPRTPRPPVSLPTGAAESDRAIANDVLSYVRSGGARPEVLMSVKSRMPGVWALIKDDPAVRALVAPLLKE